MIHPYFNRHDDLQSSLENSIEDANELGGRHRLTLLINPEIKIEECKNSKGSRRFTDKPSIIDKDLKISVGSLNKESNSLSPYMRPE